MKDFLNKYAEKASRQFNYREAEQIFTETFAQLKRLPHGLVKAAGKNSTSVVLFEAVAIGAAETISKGSHELNIETFYDWVSCPEFSRLITRATNSKPKFVNRIKFCFDKFSSVR